MPRRVLEFIQHGQPDLGEIISSLLGIGRGAWLLIPGRETLPPETVTTALRNTHIPETFFGTLFFMFGMAQFLAWVSAHRELRKIFSFFGWVLWLFLLVMYLLTNPLYPGIPGTAIMAGIGLWVYWRI